MEINRRDSDLKSQRPLGYHPQRPLKSIGTLRSPDSSEGLMTPAKESTPDTNPVIDEAMPAGDGYHGHPSREGMTMTVMPSVPRGPVTRAE